ncbi:NAD(P)/FAD-dependent oxidoreductase [Bacillus cihuensis]|uniref:NAD(P)/FAD-dependent oxidoreductase n=1 Tax=Bacillus cihuensis TaxID=1208599 RepID=UPI000426F742|nr:FAD-binding oxidoreductase [Bacillus cihuensis]
MQKFIIVGAGILGASTAYQLSKMGSEVVIIDRKDAGQATDAAAGIVCPWLSQRRNKAWYQLAKSGACFYPELIDDLEKDGETETGYARVGALSIHKEQEKINAMEIRALKRKEDAPEIGEIEKLTEQETIRLFPPLSEEYSSLHVSGAARVDGRSLRDSLLRAAQKRGAKLISGNAVLQFNGKRVIGVQVNNEKIEASKVIVCAGAWANQLLEPLGINFQVSFQKAQIIHLALPETDTSAWPVIMPPTDQYMLAFDNEKIVVGATHENTDRFDLRLTAGGLQEVLDKALDTAPGLSNSTFLEGRVGFRPFTPGFLPIIGPMPGWDGLIVANGLGASGLTMGPYIGFQIAKLVLGLPLDIELEHYDVSSAMKD